MRTFDPPGCPSRMTVDEARGLVALAPSGARSCEHDCYEIAKLLVRRGLRALLSGWRHVAGVASVEDHARIESEEQGEQHEHDSPDPATDSDAAADRHAAPVLDVPAAPAGLPTHG